MIIPQFEAGPSEGSEVALIPCSASRRGGREWLAFKRHEMEAHAPRHDGGSPSTGAARAPCPGTAASSARV